MDAINASRKQLKSDKSKGAFDAGLIEPTHEASIEIGDNLFKLILISIVALGMFAISAVIF